MLVKPRKKEIEKQRNNFGIQCPCTGIYCSTVNSSFKKKMYVYKHSQIYDSKYSHWHPTCVINKYK